MTCLKSFGISPVSIDRLTILVIIGINSDLHSFSSEVNFKTIFFGFPQQTFV